MSEGTPKFIVFRDLAKGVYRWRLRSATNETLAVSEPGYAEQVSCEQEVRRLKTENYPDAEVLDLTIRRSEQ